MDMRVCTPVTTPSFRWYIIEKPNNLNVTDGYTLFQEVYPVARAAFECDDSIEFREDVWNHIFNTGTLLFVRDATQDMKMVAFRVWSLYKSVKSKKVADIIYLAGMCVLPEYQGCGLGKRLTQLVVAPLLIDGNLQKLKGFFTGKKQYIKYVVLRTQNPIMKLCFDKAINRVSYPKFESDALIPADVVHAAKVISSALSDSDFDEKTLISRGLYGSSLYGKNPICSCRNEKYREHFDALRVDRGDSMYCVLRV